MPSVVTMTGPGTATVTDDAAVAIAAQTLAQQASFNSIILQIGSTEVPGTLLAILSGINSSLANIADADKLIAKKLSDLNISTGSIAVAQSSLTAVTAMAAANQIETNNKQVAATNEALKRAGLPEPTLPSLPEQIQTSVVNGVALNQAAVVGGAVTSFITTNTVALGTWITGTKAYTTVAGWVSDAADSILGVLPPSVSSLFAKAKGGSSA
jgi:hypothetical protein